jgi:hypothetical protein
MLSGTLSRSARIEPEGIEKALVEYYRAATGGRMHLIAAQPPAAN